MKENVIQLVSETHAFAQKNSQQPVSQELQEAIEVLIERLRNQDPISEPD